MGLLERSRCCSTKLLRGIKRKPTIICSFGRCRCGDERPTTAYRRLRLERTLDTFSPKGVICTASTTPERMLDKFQFATVGIAGFGAYESRRCGTCNGPSHELRGLGKEMVSCPTLSSVLPARCRRGREGAGEP